MIIRRKNSQVNYIYLIYRFCVIVFNRQGYCTRRNSVFSFQNSASYHKMCKERNIIFDQNKYFKFYQFKKKRLICMNTKRVYFNLYLIQQVTL